MPQFRELQGNFASMMGRVVRLLNHHLPERIGVGNSVNVDILDHPRQRRIVLPADKRSGLVFDCVPTGPDAGNIWKINWVRFHHRHKPIPDQYPVAYGGNVGYIEGIRTEIWCDPLPANEPKLFGAHTMDERIAD